MAKATHGSERREDALSRERIVDAAIELLDAQGESGLTFRALAARLATGPGAIYWHIANKNELLIAASDAIVTRALHTVATRAAPRKMIRHIAGAVFDAIDAHPWASGQLSGPPQPALLLIFERIGRQVQALGVADRAQFTAASALLSYVIGVSVQNAANRSLFPADTKRADFLALMAAQWKALDADEYPFTRNVAEQLRKHDDRAEFLAGIDLILVGITSAL
jgi:AcrR family transcriptional regulator